MSQESIPQPYSHELRRLKDIELAATELFIACWTATMRDILPERGPIPDAALKLRDALNPNCSSDPDWLPEPLASERDAGYPNL